MAWARELVWTHTEQQQEHEDVEQGEPVGASRGVRRWRFYPACPLVCRVTPWFSILKVLYGLQTRRHTAQGIAVSTRRALSQDTEEKG